jgi:rod shape-determining protein MreB
MGFFDFMTEDIAIDLGTANTLIIHNDKVVIDSPSIVARDRISAIDELSKFKRYV